MFWNHQKGNPEDIEQIHQYYMDIMNCIPDLVYWVDVDCNLLGCNNRFVQFLGLNELRDFKGTPYLQMKKFAHWSEECVEALKLEDMNAIFTGESQYNVEEKPILNDKQKHFYFKTNRVPMFDENKNVVGLVVVLTDISASKIQEQNTKSKKLPKSEQVSKVTSLPNVLMIEDNLIAQNVEKALLTALNCQVDIADTGDKALKLFDPGKYDLVLMDIGLEDTSGYVVAKQLRNMEKDTKHHVPIIALTGYEADVVKYDCEQYFMEGAITKPLTSEQAEQIINHYVYHMDVPVRGLKST
ncbi:response regulator [Legionella bononiensis]|uniref:Response regulator n=1 Tax=Legionella bononiensis TaxID=2793102 RepID=A0ABS1WFF6_9GAMM|nr:response regulator [Legionella bononiensis]MBL7481542.1 response regulator [Legionella bononiensis]MBL7528089.1 response regulator [Legionella bononiensis]MBL7562565.1 response regulator [Legionella bononiensis]